MRFDLHNGLDPSIALAPVAAAVADNTTQVTTTLNTAGQKGIELYVLTGALADAGAEFTLTMYEDDDPAMGTETAVADADLVGTEANASFTQADDSKVFKLGYIGSKQYIRAKIVITNNAAAAPLAALWLTKPWRAGEAANPPA